MRKVLPSREVYHLWANEVQDEARNSSDSVSFHRNDAYSYGTIIGRIVRNSRGERAFLVSDRTYSNTTSGHQSRLRQAIPSYATVFYVSEVARGGWNRGEDPSHADRLIEYRDRIAQAEGKAKRARLDYTRDSWQQRAVELRQEANAYCQFFDLAAAYSPAEVERLWNERQEAIRRAQQEQEAREKRDAEDRRVRYAKLAEDWRAGNDVAIWHHPDTMLRAAFDDTGRAVIETSRGATVPLEHARRLFLAWINGEAQEGDRVGHYTVARVEDGEALQIGCHYITRTEAERLARTMNWHGGQGFRETA